MEKDVFHINLTINNIVINKQHTHTHTVYNFIQGI